MHTKRGITVILVLVFMGVFALVMGTVTSYTLTQATVARAKHAKEAAFQVAEAGLEYYRWFLAHNPNDLENGEGVPGPYTYTVEDPEGGVVGEATISVSGDSVCGALQAVNISSEGASSIDPDYTRTLSARYARPSVAEYAFIINSNVWAGADRDIVGPYHSNGGIRMDGTNNSTVTSAVEDWLCTSSFGCNPNQTVDGVWGGGTGSALWEHPVPQFDFNGIGVDLAALKTYAQTDGVYFSGAAGRSGRKGYRLDFQSNGTVNVYRVRNTSYAWSLHIDDTSQWQQDYHTITNETLLGNYTIPEDCPLIFVEDKVWLEGTVSGKVTLASADLLGGNFDTDVIIEGDIDYAHSDGSDGLTVIAENSVLFPLEIPNNLSIKGIFVAQKGYYGRNLYPCWYEPYDIRNSLTMHGTIVSNQRVGTQWGYSGADCGSNQTSGFLSRANSYDRLLAADPPPFTPYASVDEEFVVWREE